MTEETAREHEERKATAHASNNQQKHTKRFTHLRVTVKSIMVDKRETKNNKNKSCTAVGSSGKKKNSAKREEA